MEEKQEGQESQQAQEQIAVGVRPMDPFDLIDKGGSQFVVHFHGKAKWNIGENFDTAGIPAEERKLFKETGALGKLAYVPVCRVEDVDRLGAENNWTIEQKDLVRTFNEILKHMSDCYKEYTDRSSPGFEDGWRFVPKSQVSAVEEMLTKHRDAVAVRVQHCAEHLEELYNLQLPKVRQRILASAMGKAHIPDPEAHADACMNNIRKRIPQTAGDFARAVGIDFGKRALRTPGLVHGDSTELQGSKDRVKTWCSDAGDYMIDKFVDVFKNLQTQKVIHKGSMKAHARAFDIFEQMNSFIRNKEAADLIRDFKDYHKLVDSDTLRGDAAEMVEFKAIVDDLVTSLEEMKGREINPFGAEGRSLF